MTTPLPTESEATNRRRAALFVSPFLAVGLVNLAALLGWGMDPLWAFAILPPILFFTVLGWIAFRTGVGDRPATGDGGQ
ncbi:hypothetical protein ACFOZ7_19240 [Natribaculum luteum]|uniref:DUF8142 domain-containing protein n=1 Tax=Natribaculum luteum TaxID=1586232 RepID=A0ABD5P4I1_9EURY|nr:hypothetical protein [Natribaculum luteum]